MADNLTKAQRSYCMARIRSKNTLPELNYKKRAEGFIYHPKNIFGKPDFINYNKKTVIFIDGCFWHKCPTHYVPPKTNKQYWLPKLEKNVVREQEIKIAYESAGWKVIRIWEHNV